MREILFKAKRLDNGEWVEGHYAFDECALIIQSLQYRPENERPNFVEVYPVIPSTVCEYTGLTDKNGKKIFEGDILNENGEHFTVVYDSNWAKFKLQYLHAIQYPEWNRGVLMEVVGSIHDGEGGRHERSPEVRMKCNKDCIANVCGECAVEKCEGQIQRLGIRNNNAETAAWTYKIAVDSFKDYFGKKDADQ